MDPKQYAQLALQEAGQIIEQVDAAYLQALVDAIVKARAVFVAGTGRSLLMQRAFAMRLMHLGLDAHVVGDVTTPAIGSHDLLIIASGSGEIATLSVIADKAVMAGASLAVFTIHPASTLAGKASLVVTIPGATDKIASDFLSQQPAGSSFEQALLMALDGVVLALIEQRDQEGRVLADGFARHANLE
ncbi:MAG: SIS domain-containing protein [Symbiobacteriaceae bacterium]|nr:SIS domain-containing protein [Symbiobacteriaceae bacterium]